MEYVEKTLGKIIRDLAKSNPDGLAVDFADRDFKKTWKEFDEETTAVSKGLMAIGVNAGVHVGDQYSRMDSHLVCDGENRSGTRDGEHELQNF